MAGSGTRRVLVGHGLNRDCALESVLLPHPATGRAAAFLLSPDGGLLELNHMKSEFTSWFVGDSVVEGALRPRAVAAVAAWLTDPALAPASLLVWSAPTPDGGVYAATVFDILFVLLPVLEHHRKKVRGQGSFLSSTAF